MKSSLTPLRDNSNIELNFNQYKEPDFKEVLGEKGCDMIVEAYPWFYELFEYET